MQGPPPPPPGEELNQAFPPPMPVQPWNNEAPPQPDDPVDDPKFTKLKKWAVRMVYASFVLTALNLAVKIFYIVEEYKDECTFYSKSSKEIKDTVMGGVILKIISDGVLVGIELDALLKYKGRRYQNLFLLIVLGWDAVTNTIFFLVWASTSAGQALEKGGDCQAFAIFCLIVVPPTIIIGFAGLTIHYLFREHVKKVRPNMLTTAGENVDWAPPAMIQMQMAPAYGYGYPYQQPPPGTYPLATNQPPPAAPATK